MKHIGLSGKSCRRGPESRPSAEEALGFPGLEDVEKILSRLDVICCLLGVSLGIRVGGRGTDPGAPWCGWLLFWRFLGFEGQRFLDLRGVGGFSCHALGAELLVPGRKKV